jgi:hypothetical protein
MPLELTITNRQKIPVTCHPTASGKPVPVDGKLFVDKADGESTWAEATDSEPLTVTLISSDNPGTTVYLLKVDADVGEGVEELADTVTLHVEGAKADSMGMVAGVPEDK